MLIVAILSFTIASNLLSQESDSQEMKIMQHLPPEYLYKIVSLQQWQTSLQQTEIALSSLDDDFIHLAKAEQVKHVAQKFWENQDYIVLKLASNKLVGQLIYETNPGGSTHYYHLYEGDIPHDAVVDVTFSLPADTVRAAIDFGSGAVKIQMAEVNTKQNRLVGESLLATYTPLCLTEDIATHHGIISDEMAEQAISILRRFKEEAIRAAALKGHHEIQFTGIATDVFRKAQNGAGLLQLFEEKLGIRFQILPQEEEGRLGFLTAKALYPEVPEECLVAWDSGNGSFQMTTLEDGHYQIYQGPLGHGTVRVILSQEIRQAPILRGHEFGNPVLLEEADQLAERIKTRLSAIPDWLHEKLNSKNSVVATFGDGESIFAVVARALAYLDGKKEPVQQAVISLLDVQRVIEAFIEQGDDVFMAADLHGKTLTSAVHLAALMEHFDIQAVHYKKTIGNTSGMLLAPELW